MKKINKTLLLASTLFVSSAITLTDNAFASDEAKLNVEPSTNLDNIVLEPDQYLDQEAVDENEDLLNPSEETDISLTQEDTTNELDQNIDTYEDSHEEESNKDAEISSEKELEEDKVLKYDDRNLDDIFKLVDEGESYYENTASTEAKEIANPVKTADINPASVEKKEEAELSTNVVDIEKKEYYAPKGTGVIVNENNSLKYYENNKLVKSATVVVNDKFYNIDDKGNATNPKSLWTRVGDNVYYVDKSGSISKGISEIQGKKYYFNQDGLLQRNRKLVTSESYYEVSNKGEMIAPTNKWVKVNNKTYYNGEDGKLNKGVKNVGGKLYYFNKDGELTGNKKLVTETRVLFVDNSGLVSNPKNQWANVGGSTYRTDANGKMLKGLQTIDNNTYLFNDEGKMYQNDKVISAGKFYQIDNRGVVTNPKNSWVELNGKKYHTNEAGFVKEGVWRIDNEYYYFTENGLTPNQVVTQKGVVYTVDEKGIATKEDNNMPGAKSIDKAMEWMFKARDNKLTYNMGAGRNSATQADCSSAVYRSLIYGGFLEQGSWVGNTETLFQMGSKGTIMYEIKESEIQHGDIFVSGTPGRSNGAAGHTGFILNPKEDTIIHMSYGKNGVAVTPRKGYMGDGRGLPVKYFRLVGANSTGIYEYMK